MMSAEDYVPLLKRNYLFYRLTDEQILDFAQRLKTARRAAKEIIFEQGEFDANLYIIERGSVKVFRAEGKKLRTVAIYEAGDHFGLLALLENTPQSATVVTETETQLLRLDKKDFFELLKRYPQIKPNLLTDARTQKLARQLKFTWLMPSEVIYMIARRHSILLAQSLLAPGLLAVLVLLGAAALNAYAGLQAALWLLGLSSLPLGLWGVWNWIDWGNDFYIITNRRVVYLERIVGIYDSRQESPLNSILSVSVQSADALARSLDIGDVVVRTFSGPITMDSVPRPRALAALVEEHWHRAKQGAREAEQETVRQAVRRTLQPMPPRTPAPPPTPSAPPKPAPLGERLARFFSLKVRFEEGGYITYRKHWFLLIKDIWLSSALMVLVVVGLIVVAFLASVPAEYKLVMVVLGVFVIVGLALWWLYEFVDWRNDIYQIATDQIIDINRKPLGRETRKAAPLGNVLSLRYERVGLLGLLFNYGTVIANIGTAEFRFEGVFDPKDVQNDIYRRMEALTARKAQAETDKRREEISMWIGAYHEIASEAREQESPLPPAQL